MINKEQIQCHKKQGREAEEKRSGRGQRSLRRHLAQTPNSKLISTDDPAGRTNMDSELFEIINNAQIGDAIIVKTVKTCAFMKNVLAKIIIVRYDLSMKTI